VYGGWGRSTLIELTESFLLERFQPESAMNILAVADYLEQAIRESYSHKSIDELEMMDTILQRVAPQYGGLNHTVSYLGDFRAKLQKELKSVPPTPEVQQSEPSSLEDVLTETSYRVPAWERHSFASIISTVAGEEKYQKLYRALVPGEPQDIGPQEFLKQFTIVPDSVTPSAAVLAYDAGETRHPYLRPRILLMLQKDGDRTRICELAAELVYTPVAKPLKPQTHELVDIVGQYGPALAAAQEAADMRMDAKRAAARLREKTGFTAQNQVTYHSPHVLLPVEADKTSITVESYAPESALQRHTRPNWFESGVRITVAYKR
jgi:hypothetical protein